MAGTPVIDLEIVADDDSHEDASPARLAQLAQRDFSLTGIVNTKASLFFIGRYQDAAPRGLYMIAKRYGDPVLDKACEIERESIGNGTQSPFRFWNDDITLEKPCVLGRLKNAFSTRGRIQWRQAMITLKNGVQEAARFLDDEDSAPVACFHAHGVGGALGGAEVIIEVPEGACDANVCEGARIAVGGELYTVRNASAADGSIRIAAQKE